MKFLPIKFIKNQTSKHKKHLKFSVGFTLIEMLVVIAIISSLSALFISSFPASQRRARDARRRSDLKQYDAQLRDYAIRKGGFYPGAVAMGMPMKCTGACTGSFCTAIGLTDSSCPIDQYDGQNKCFDNLACSYYYQGNNCIDVNTACANSFVLRAHMEGEAGWLVYCSNGSTGVVAETTNWTTLAGTCPL